MNLIVESLSDLSARVLQSGSIESLALFLWGCGLLGISARVRSLIAPARTSGSPARTVQYASERRSLTESRALAIGR